MNRTPSGGTPRVSLKEIGKLANVSVATASKILRGKDESSAETRRRVLDVAARLKYRPNLLVQGIQTGRTQTVGVMLPSDSVYQGTIGRGVHDELLERDYVPIQLWVRADLPAERARQVELEQIHRLVDRRVDGVILWPLDPAAPERHFGELTERGIPFVTVDRDAPRADHVGTDDAAGGLLAAVHLLGLGHRRVVHIAGNPRSSSFNARRRAFVDAIVQAGGECMVIEAARAEDLLPAARRVMAMRPRPTAVFAARDDAALRLYSAAAEAGVSIPGELSVVGYGDRDFAADLCPGLTTVRQDPYAVGRAAARRLMELIDAGGRAGKPVKVYHAPTLVVRGSTGSPRD